MTKKIIALVLFVAMMLACVPASAHGVVETSDVGTQLKAYIMTGDEALWYAKAAPEKLELTGNKGTIGIYKDGDGVEVEIENNDAKKVVINITGSLSELEAFYYTTYANGFAGQYHDKAFRIPFKVNAGENEDVTANTYINGTAAYYSMMYDAANKVYVYYLSDAFTYEDSTYTYYIDCANHKRATVVVNWDNTDNDPVAKAKSFPSMAVVAIAGAQVDNFRASYINETKDAIGRLTFNIAAMTKADRQAIWHVSFAPMTKKFEVSKEIALVFESLGYQVTKKNGTYTITVPDNFWNALIDLGVSAPYVEIPEFWEFDPNNDVMDVRFKVYDPSGVVYPAGTIVSIQNVEYSDTLADGTMVYLWDEYLGKSEKFVNLGYQPTYLIDKSGCFVFSFAGISDFAFDARGRFDTDVAFYTKKVMEEFTLRFTNGTKQAQTTFEIFFQNTQRSKSGITVLNDNMTVVKGESTKLAYIVDDPMAMNQDVEWKSVNSSIVEVTDSAAGTIKAKAVGTTYIFATDAKGNTHVIVVNVVSENIPVVPETPVESPYTKYVVTASKLNIRKGPGTSYGTIGSFTRNDVVEGIEVAGTSWVKVVFGDQEAYCSGKYLAEIE